MRRAFIAVLLAAGTLALPGAPASAAEPTNFLVSGPTDGYVDDYVVGLENTGLGCTGTMVDVLDESDAVVTTVALADTGTDDQGTVQIPDSIAFGGISLLITCESAGGPHEQKVKLDEYAALDVTKIVEGDPAPGTTFTITVDCEGDEPVEPKAAAGDDTAPYDLEFGTAGGTDRVWFFGIHVCDVTETDDGGAESSSVESTDCGEVSAPAAVGPSAEVIIYEPELCTADVTNVFPDAVDDNVIEPPAALPAQAAPTFTG